MDSVIAFEAIGEGSSPSGGTVNFYEDSSRDKRNHNCFK